AGIVLSGSLGDGSFGLACIKQSGGIAIIQNPEEAIVPSMPLSALRGVEIDYIVRATEMAPLIVKLARGQIEGGAAMSSDASRPCGTRNGVNRRVAAGQAYAPHLPGVRWHLMGTRG